jgi:hypothetical protein
MVAVVAGFTALSFQFGTSVRKKHQSIKLAQKPAIIGYHMLAPVFLLFIYFSFIHQSILICCQNA